jgi:hypothetical protein
MSVSTLFAGLAGHLVRVGPVLALEWQYRSGSTKRTVRSGSTPAIACQGLRLAGHRDGIPAPGSPQFHHTIAVTQLRATVDVRIHYSFEPENARTPGEPLAGPGHLQARRLPPPPPPAHPEQLRQRILRTMAAVRKYAEAHAADA